MHRYRDASTVANSRLGSTWCPSNELFFSKKKEINNLILFLAISAAVFQDNTNTQTTEALGLSPADSANGKFATRDRHIVSILDCTPTFVAFHFKSCFSSVSNWDYSGVIHFPPTRSTNCLKMEPGENNVINCSLQEKILY